MMHRLPSALTALAATFLFAAPAAGQSLTSPPSGDNNKCVVKQYMGPMAYVKVVWNSPDVTSPSGEDRTGRIWGELVPYDLTDLGFGYRNPSPWRVGANENTTVTLSHDMLVEGEHLPAGTYGFHLIVREEGQPWTAIFSHNNSAWGSFFYDESEDALRVDAMPGDHAFTEWLTFDFPDKDPEACTMAMRWENKSFPLRFEVPGMTDLYLQAMRRDLQGVAGFRWQSWQQAAQFCLNREVNLDEGLRWAEAAVSQPFIGQENFNTLQTKADLLKALGREEEAGETMEEALRHPTASVFQIHQYGRQLIADGRKDEALEVFAFNAERFKDTWPVHVGLARGYSAVGDYKKALKHARVALPKAPDDLNRNNLSEAIEKLERGEDFN